MLQFAGENASALRTSYGNISTASVGAIQRGLLALEEQGGLVEPGHGAEDVLRQRIAVRERTLAVCRHDHGSLEVTRETAEFFPGATSENAAA